ncbi:hypothetical protein BRAS3843_2660009 [Bradyrhizobium sp. STM 3843]|nr:hypothetical protein BRAS3843_2660009 [Bradyrhizobium sp. STM 3843]
MICPTRQADRRATEWHDGQLVHDGVAGAARRVHGAFLSHRSSRQLLARAIRSRSMISER